MIRVLLIGCGDVALRTARLLHPKVRLYGLTRRVEDSARLRAHGIVPIIGDLDRLRSLDRLRTAPFAVMHFAPPPSGGRDESVDDTAYLVAGAATGGEYRRKNCRLPDDSAASLALSNVPESFAESRTGTIRS